MANIQSMLKSEIVRLARKEVRAKTDALKKTISPYRGAIAALKRRVRTLEQEAKRQESNAVLF